MEQRVFVRFNQVHYNLDLAAKQQLTELIKEPELSSVLDFHAGLVGQHFLDGLFGISAHRNDAVNNG
jgi:hypothetical protein